MNENKVVNKIISPFVVVRKEHIGKKPVVFIYSFIGKELFELVENWEIRTYEMINGQRTINDIVDSIYNEFKINESDILNFINELTSFGIIYIGRIPKLNKITKFGNSPDIHKAFLDAICIFGLKNLSFPIRARLLLTLRCNLDCSFCYVKSGKPYRKISTDEMSTNQIKVIIDEVSKKGTFIMDISGGEPFLRKDIIEVLAYATNKIPIVYVLTNGIILSDKEIARSLKKAVKNNLLFIQISLNEDHEDVSQNSELGANFEKVINGIKNTIACKLNININTAVTKHNLHNLENIVSLTHKLGIKRHTFSEFLPVACGKDEIKDLLCTPYEYFKLQNEIIPRLQKKFPDMELIGKIIEPEFWNDARKKIPNAPTYGSCAAYTTDITIGPDGKVLPCAWFAAFPEFYGPNVTDNEIANIWKEDELIKKIRKIQIKGKCERCEFNQLCYKGCLALKYSLYKKLTIPDVKCWYLPGVPSSRKPPRKITNTFLIE